MRQFLLATFLLLASFAFNSCDSSKKELQTNIEAANKECPMDLGMFGEISSMEFDEDADEVIMTMTISKDMPLKISALNKLKNTLKRAMLGNWAKSDSGIQLMKEIAKADSKITLVMQTEDTNENVKISKLVGKMQHLVVGGEYIVKAQYKRDKKYGDQYTPIAIYAVIPQTRETQLLFLKSMIPGVRRSIA